MLDIRRLPVAGKVTLFNALGLVVLGAITLTLGYMVMTGVMERQAVATQALSMRVAHSIVENGDDAYALADGRLTQGGRVLDGDMALVDAIAKATGGSATIFRGDVRVATTVLKEDGSRAVGTALAAGPARDAVLGAGQAYRGTVDILGSTYYAGYDPLKDKEGRVVGILYVGLKKADLLAEFNRGITWIALGALVLTLIMSVSALGLARWMLAPLGRLSARMDGMRQGRLDQPVPDREKQDDVGEMARAVESFRLTLMETEGLRREQEQQRQKAEQARVASLRTMADTVEDETRHAVDAVAAQTQSMDAEAKVMAAAADRMGNNAQNVAAAAEQALANAQTVASATNQLTASIGEITAQVAHASAVTRDSVAASAEAATAIDALSESVTQIGGIAGLIADIASQTNLLALNATIEAARAGEAGKGFAVVASEVKNLASQTARATEDIAQRIQGIGAVRDRAVAAVSDITHQIQQVDQVAAGIAAAMEEQSAATTEIARNVEQTADAAREVASRIAEVSAEAAQTDRCANDVQVAAHQMADSVEHLRETLVRVVRTASTDVDRRRRPRFAVSIDCQVEQGGRTLAGRVVNLSEGGAMLTVAGIAPSPGVLVMAGLRLPFRTPEQAQGAGHVKFALTDAEAAALRARFAGLTAGAMAA